MTIFLFHIILTMSTNLGFIYIKLNPDYTYYFKGGYTECPERRLHDGISEHLEKSRFETIYKIIKNESGSDCVDRIIFELAIKTPLSQCPNISNLRNYLLYKGSGTEFIDNRGKEIFKQCVEEDLRHFGVDVCKLSDEEVAIINNAPMPRSKTDSHIDSLYKRLQLKETINEITPHQHQIEVLDKVGDKYLTADILKLYWACGLGKALVGILIVKHLGFKKVVIGVPSIYLQEQMKKEILRIYPNEDNILFVGGNETNDISHITERMDSNETIFIITTYHSCKFIQHLKGIDYKIGDEAHHLVGKMADAGFRSFHNIQSKKTLFMTATEKIDELKEERAYSMDNIEQFGDYLDIKTVYWAIENKKITDYNILLIKNTEAEIDEILTNLKIKLDTEHDKIPYVTKKSLFTSCYMTLISLIQYTDLTHILMYTNTIDEASICTIYLHKLLPYFKSLGDIYIKDLHSKSNINLEKEVESFKESTYGIIPCIRIFGEGFDLPRLNGVCIASNMESEIRCVQALLRPNRKDKYKPDKIAYILLPYLVSMWDFESLSYKTVTNIIYQMRNIDEKIEQKIKVVELKSSSSPTTKRFGILYSEFEDNPDELSRIKIKLRHSKALISGLSQEENEYEYYKSVAKPFQFKSSYDYVLATNTNDELKKDPHIYFSEIWRDKGRFGWYEFLSIDTKGLICTKGEWKQFCKEKNIDSIQKYNDMCRLYNQLPIEPNEYYIGFTSVLNELELNLRRRR
jgi:superfamily II DNA or RNA helicase